MMKTTKKVLYRIWWLGRGTATTMGVAMMLAIVLSVGTTALAAVPGDPFGLGQTNTIDNALTKLAGSNPGGPMLVVDNDSPDAGSRALDLRVEAGKAPINVNADAGRAANLNADKVDGKGADEIGVNGLEEVRVLGSLNSESQKTEVASCPAGKDVISGAVEISGGTTGAFPDQRANVALTGTDVTNTNVLGIASEVRAFTGNWRLIATAICATEGTP